MLNLTIDALGILRATLELFRTRRVFWAGTVLGAIYAVVLILFFVGIIIAASLTVGDGSTAEYERLVALYTAVAVALAFPLHFPVVWFINFAASDELRPTFLRDFRITRHDLISVILLHAYVLLTSGFVYLGYWWLGREVAESTWYSLFVSTPILTVLSILFILPATTFANRHPQAWQASKQWLREGGPAMYVVMLLLQWVITAPFVLPGDSIENYLTKLESPVPEEALTAWVVVCLAILVLTIAACLVFLAFPAGYRYWLRDRIKQS